MTMHQHISRPLISRGCLVKCNEAVRDDFRIAVERARKRIGERLWVTMSSHAQSTEIYRELRALDAERVAQQAARKPTNSGSSGTSK
jgi:hypothetical protein